MYSPRIWARRYGDTMTLGPGEQLALPRCFVAMPITTSKGDAEHYGDQDHWDHVYETLFAPAIRQAGLEPVKPVTEGAHLIHAEIVKNLTDAEIVLVDLSGHNPNVFFEFGVRTAVNKPIAVVRDEHTEIPFDTSGINTHRYIAGLHGWSIASQIDDLAKHLQMSVASCKGANPLWRQFGLRIKAESPQVDESASDARLDLLVGGVDELRHELSALRRQVRSRQNPSVYAGASETTDFESEVLRLAPPGMIDGIARGPGNAEIHSAVPLPRSLASIIAKIAESRGLDVSFKITPNGEVYDPFPGRHHFSRDHEERKS